MTVLVAAAMAACAFTAEAASGRSDWFYVDTTDTELKISDVTSKYFDGEHGGSSGRKSTFLNGTPCEIEMTIVMDDDSEVDHWLVNGSTVEVFYTAEGWACTSRGYIKSEWLEVDPE